jgi:hypothetical protein
MTITMIPAHTAEPFDGGEGGSVQPEWRACRG